MAGFSATDTALTGFRVVWRQPLAVLWWAVLQFAVALGVNAFIVLSAGPALMKLRALGSAPNVDPAAALSLFTQVTPTYVALTGIVLVFYAVVWAAMNRAVLRPEQSRFGYLRLSADELRQLGLLSALLIGALLICVALGVIAEALAELLALVAGGQAGGAALALAVVIPLAVCLCLYLVVRLSLASALTFSSHRMGLLGSWMLTRGRFWPLFGTYLIAFGLNFVVGLLAVSIALALAAIQAGGFAAIPGIVQAEVRPDLSNFSGMLQPGRLIYLAVSAVGTALSWPVTMTPPAAIYRALAGDTGSKAFD